MFAAPASNVDLTPALDPSKAGGIDITEHLLGMKEADVKDKLGEKTRRKEMKIVSVSSFNFKTSFKMSYSFYMFYNL